MMTTSVDWKSEGLHAGSNKDELDWKGWKRPLISRLKARLLRNRTYDDENESEYWQSIGHSQDSKLQY